MQMLHAGGMAVLADGRRPPDEHNPGGYFEFEEVKNSRNDLSWLDQAGGKVVKVVHLLLQYLPASRDYRVIFMLRDLGEVVQSQRIMLKQQGRPTAELTDAALAAIFAKQLASVREQLVGSPNFRVLYVNYRDVIDHPADMAGQINLFLGGNMALAQMAAAVNPALYRQRKTMPRNL